MLKWLRINLGLTVAVVSFLSAIGGALVSGTLRVAETNYQIEDLARSDRDMQKQMDQFHRDMVNVDQRLNDGTNRVSDLRRTRDGEVAALQQRVAVLEAQLRFLADRTPVPPIGASR